MIGYDAVHVMLIRLVVFISWLGMDVIDADWMVVTDADWMVVTAAQYGTHPKDAH